MPRMTLVKHSETTACGKELLDRFKYWLTKNRQWKKQDHAGVLCKSFCPACKYYEECSDTLKKLEELNEL